MRVLVVEDATRLADGIAEGLRDEGMAVDVSYDGVNALMRVAVNRYDVVVLDRDLPGVHGDDVCRQVVEDDEGPMVLMLTAADASIDRVEGLRIGADDYLTKPFNFDELVLRVRGLARRRPRASPRILRAADVELDSLERVATRSGRKLDLSVNEFGVLEALMRAAPAPLSPEDLLERVWDEHADPFTKTVYVTISRLRRKLGDPDIITNVARVGYRVAGEQTEVQRNDDRKSRKKG
jgi:DNA-binding response OmpR family regulator